MTFLISSSPAHRLFFISGTSRLLSALCGFTLLFYLRRQRRKAQSGDEKAAGSLILPVFEPIILLFSAALLTNYIFLYFSTFSPFFGITSITWALLQFCQIGVTMVFLSRSLSQAAIRRSAVYACMWGMFGFLCSIAYHHHRFVGAMLLDGVPFCFFMIVYLKKSLRRKSVVPYCVFMMFYTGTWILYNIADYVQSLPMQILGVSLLACLELPLSILVYIIMLNDTHYWRTGCHILAVFSRTEVKLRWKDFQEGRRRKRESLKIQTYQVQPCQQQDPNQPNMNVSINVTPGSCDSTIASSLLSATSSSSNSLSSAPNSLHSPRPSFSSSAQSPSISRFLQTMDPSIALLSPKTADTLLSRDLHSLIEDNAQRLIDFAYVEIGTKPLGYGKHSRVFEGKYRGSAVALKFFSADHLTKDTILSYAKETAIAASLKHPNIVSFHGLCIRPPCVFIVMELCASSLFDMLPEIRYHPLWSMQAVLAWAIQAAKPVAYLHQLGYVHRDLKSLNYMVSHQGELKLTDFGLSRMFPQLLQNESGSDSSDAGTSATANATTPFLSPSDSSASLSTTQNIYRKIRRKLNGEQELVVDGKRNPHLTRRVGTRCWMSPEMLRGDKYSTASDIYSLTTCIWEILTCCPPYEDVEDEMEICELILNHATPVIPDYCPTALRTLLERGWSADPKQRPTAQEMVDTLERMLLEFEAEFQLPRFDSSALMLPVLEQQMIQPTPVDTPLTPAGIVVPNCAMPEKQRHMSKSME